jgi:hypothetical protein
MDRDKQPKVKDKIVGAILIVMISLGALISFGGNYTTIL